MSRKYIAREVLKRLRLGEPLGEELIRKFIRFLPELYKNYNGYDDFAKLRHDVFSAFQHDHADRLIGFDLGVCLGALSEEESVSLDCAQEITSLWVDNSKLRELARLVSEYISHDRCEGCVVKTACNSHELDECWMTTKLRNQLRDLGMEVDG